MIGHKYIYEGQKHNRIIYSKKVRLETIRIELNIELTVQNDELDGVVDVGNSGEAM
jgi:hypothetical protein